MARKRDRSGSVRFDAEHRALKKVQVHFEFQQSLMHKVRVEAAKENLSPSDYVRKIVGLPYSKIQRPRISLSFSPEDISLLAAKYGEPPKTQTLKQCVISEIEAYFADIPPGSA